jgi:hypothetical protein
LSETNWTYDKLTELIKTQTEENLNLDYKAAEAFGKTDFKRKEITKDVSSFANSAGGTIIYGIKEFDEEDKKHLPEKIDSIPRQEFPKEWLEQVINNIQPKIQNTEIISIEDIEDPTRVIYLVNIPQSITAHQAMDKRYYKRYNFISIPMEDYEIKDILNRQATPLINLEFNLEIEYNPRRILGGIAFPKGYGEITPSNVTLEIYARNLGKIYAKYINAFIYVPIAITNTIENISEIENIEYSRLYCDNLVYAPKHVSSRYEILLPTLRCFLRNIYLHSSFDNLNFEEHKVIWEVFADNAIVRKGEQYLKNLPPKIINNSE